MKRDVRILLLGERKLILNVMSNEMCQFNEATSANSQPWASAGTHTEINITCSWIMSLFGDLRYAYFMFMHRVHFSLKLFTDYSLKILKWISKSLFWQEILLVFTNKLLIGIHLDLTDILTEQTEKSNILVKLDSTMCRFIYKMYTHLFCMQFAF